MGMIGCVLATACGGEAPVPDAQPGEPQVQEAPLIRPGVSDRIILEFVAGLTPENSYWNFNGLYGGKGLLLIPLGSEVEIDFRNADPAMAHSIGITRWVEPFPADFAPIEPAFPGAMIPHAGSPEHATPPEGRAGFRFRASEPGDFAVVCYVPGHAAVGGYVRLRIVEGLSEARLEP